MRLKCPAITMSLLAIVMSNMTSLGCGLIVTNSHICSEAHHEMNTQALVEWAALKDKNPNIRAVSINGLTDQPLLAKIVADDGVYLVQENALHLLTNQMLLVDIALTNTNQLLCVYALQKISDQTLLARIVTESSDPYLCFGAILKLTEQALLSDILMKNGKLPVRNTGPLRNRKLKVIGFSENPEEDLRSLVFQRLTNQNLLATFAIANTGDCRRVDAILALTDQAAIERVALVETDIVMLYSLLRKLLEPSRWQRLASGAAHRSTRLAAQVKCGNKTWKEIFSEATAQGVALTELKDAIYAVGVFSDQTESEVQKSVREVCQTLIRKGDEARIQPMLVLLERFGDRLIVEDFLECGQDDLMHAAQNWSKRRNIIVGQRADGCPIKWGSAR